MSRPPTLTELVRDAALDDDAGIHRALVLVKRLNVVYGRDAATRKALSELADILIGVQQRARCTHQAAERAYQASAAERADAARRELAAQDEAQEAILAQFR